MDAQEIRKWHSVFKRDDELFEIRILGDRTWSGYFYDVEQAIAQLASFDNYNIYYSLNEVKRACNSREQFNCFRQVKGTATSKTDIEHRWWIACDVDCERPSGVSSTDAEKAKAYKKAQDVFVFLRDQGFSIPVVCDSSSGYHLLYPIDMDNSQESEDCVKNFLEILSDKFSDENVKIDKVLHDANRILRLPGSHGRKGRSSEERPHRLAKILYVPDTITRMPREQVETFNKQFKIEVEQPVRTYNNYNSPAEEFNLREFITKHGIEVAKEVPMSGGGTKYILAECPFDSGHKAPDSALFEMPNGAIAFKCYHNSCSHYGWREFRLHYDPHAYDPKPQQRPYQPQQRPQPQQPLPQPQPKQPEILSETEDRGKKWLSLKDIKKVNIDELEHFKTGFTALDGAIKGIFMSSLVIVSGSNSSGKSSWLNSLIVNTIQQGYKAALWSGELNPAVLKGWIQMVAAGRRHLAHQNTPDGGYYYVPNNIGSQIDDWMEDKFFLYNNEYTNKWQQLFHDMWELVRKGVRVFILDNLFSLDIDIFDGDSNKKQKELINQLVEFKKKTNSVIILVAHPRKTTTFIRKNDISGTGNITDAADYIFILHRVNNDFRKAGGDFFGAQYIQNFFGFSNVLEVSKDRMKGTQDFLVGMYYEIESRRFKNTNEEDKEYGWRGDTGVQQTMFAQAPPPPTNPTMPFDPPTDDMPF